jgi:DNA polymerase elongation subunit (family B)
MALDFYTSVTAFSDNILIRGYENGVAVKMKVPYQPSFYIKSKTPTKDYKTIFNEPLKRHQFGSIKEAKTWLAGTSAENIPVYGNSKMQYQYIGDIFYGKNVIADFNLIRTEYVDIETTVHITGKFPDVNNPLEEINLLTFINEQTKFKTVFGAKPYKNTDPTVKYHHYSDEKEMLMAVVDYWRRSGMDIISGWNSLAFDIPYIVARIELLLGEDYAKKLSPFGMVWKRESKDNFGNAQTLYTIVGIVQLDYLLLYKKFQKRNKPESYKLAVVADHEKLSKQKIELDHGFYEMYTNHWDTFVLYNIMDTEVVVALEEKVKFIRLAVMLGHKSKGSFEDSLGTVSIWQTLVYNNLLNKNIITPLENDKPYKDIVGANVKEPIPGFYEWICSIDATSLYPSLAMMINMSPETIVDDMFVKGTMEEFIDGTVDTDIGDEYSVACNGHVFRNDIKGFLPEIFNMLFEERKEFKNLKKKSEQVTKDIKAELIKRGLEA